MPTAMWFCDAKPPGGSSTLPPTLHRKVGSDKQQDKGRSETTDKVTFSSDRDVTLYKIRHFSNYFLQNTAFSPLFSPRDLCSLRRFEKITTFSVVSNRPPSYGDLFRGSLIIMIIPAMWITKKRPAPCCRSRTYLHHHVCHFSELDHSSTVVSGEVLTSPKIYAIIMIRRISISDGCCILLLNKLRSSLIHLRIF